MKAELSIEHAAKKIRRQVWSIGIFSGETLSDLNQSLELTSTLWTADGLPVSMVDGLKT